MSYVSQRQPALDQIKKGDVVRVQLSKTRSPLWTVHRVVYDSKTKRNVYELRKPDGSIHSELLAREQLTLEEDPWRPPTPEAQYRRIRVNASSSADTRGDSRNGGHGTHSVSIIRALPTESEFRPLPTESESRPLPNPLPKSATFDASEPSVESISSPGSPPASSSWKLSAPATTGRYTHTDAVTTVPSAAPLKTEEQDIHDDQQPAQIGATYIGATTTASSAQPPSMDEQDPKEIAIDDFDLATQGLPPNEKRDYAEAFARSIREAIGAEGENAQLNVIPTSKLAELFQDYAAMLKPEAGRYHDAVKFIHRQRELIGDYLRDPNLESHSREANDDDTSEATNRAVVPHHVTEERIEAWILSIVDAQSPLAEKIPDSSASDVSFLEDSRQFLQTGLPWKWLTTTLRSLARLTWQDCGWMDDLSNKLTLAVDGGATMHTVVCQVDWDPISFLSRHYPVDAQPQLSEVVTITGWGNHIQGTTCSEYVQQTWPLHGMCVLEAVEDAIRSPDAQSHGSIGDNLAITIKLHNARLTTTLHGHIPILVPVIAQMAWFGAACVASPRSTQHCYTSVRASLSEATIPKQCTISYERNFTPPSPEHSCWFSMGRNMSIASGFPVLARMQDEKGLEMDFELMASFGDTDHVTSFADSFLLKGFSSILQPSAKIGQSIIWHFLSGPEDKFLPYTAVKNTHPVPKLELDEVMCCRNFVGWTSAAEIWSDADLSGVREPSRLSPDAPITLEKATISGGKFITVGATFGLGNHQKAFYRTVERQYKLKVWEARQWPVVLYDTDAKRAWLEDGASALLQITHGQLRSEWFRKMYNVPDVSFTDFRRRGGDDSQEVLLDPLNLGLELDFEVSGTVIKRTWDKKGNFLGEQPEQTLAQWTFRDQVAENFELLAKMRAHQDMATTGQSGIKLSASYRERLEGWSFRDLLRCRGELKPKMVMLEPSGRGWEPLTRQINAITLMGGGFGEIITPGPATDPCCGWTRVPVGQDLLTVSYELLKEIAENHRADDFPHHLIPGMQWHQPDYLFQSRCTANTTSHKNDRRSAECGRIQVIISSWLLGQMGRHLKINLVKPPQLESIVAKDYDLSPAVIFGRPRKNWWPGQPIFRASLPQNEIESKAQTAPPTQQDPVLQSLAPPKGVPLPSFSSMLSAQDHLSQTESGSSRSETAPNTDGSTLLGSTSMTSVSALPLSGKSSVAHSCRVQCDGPSTIRGDPEHTTTTSPQMQSGISTRSDVASIGSAFRPCPSEAPPDPVGKRFGWQNSQPFLRSQAKGTDHALQPGSEYEIVGKRRGTAAPLQRLRNTRRACFEDLRRAYIASEG